MSKFVLLLLTIGAFTAHGASKPLVSATLAPITFLIQEIGQTQFEYNTLVHGGMDPHNFAPTPQDIKKLYGSNIFFQIGLPLENNILNKTEKQKFITVNLSQNLARLKNHDKHDHHENHQEFDTHVWLSPSRLLTIVDEIYLNLKPIATDKLALEKNYFNTKEKLQTLFDQLKIKLKPHQGKNFLVFHPSFGYFANDFSLTQLSIELDGKTPSPKHLKEIISLSQEHQIKTIFIQPQFSKSAAKIVANTIHGNFETLNPLAENIFENLQEIANKLERSFKL